MALLLLPCPVPFLHRQQYPRSIVRLRFYREPPRRGHISTFVCKRKTHSENTPRGRTRARGARLGRGPGGRRTRPAPGGEGMRAPPEVPQSRGGRKGRASGRPRPVAAVTAPTRAPPPPPRCQAASPSHRVGAAAARAPHPPGPALHRRGERGARNLLSASGGRPCPGGRPRNGGGSRRRRPAPHPRPRPPRPAAIRAAPTSARGRASVCSGRGSDDSLPAADSPHPELIIIPSGRAGGRRRGGAGPSCACAGLASL